VSLAVAVTGASGFIGRHVVRALSARGDRVLAVRRPFEAAMLRDTFRGLDAVVHLAGVVSTTREREFFEANVEGTRTLAAAAAAAGARIVFVSSLAAGGPAPPSAPRDEADPPAPINAYGRSKLEGERAVTSMPHLRWTILRPGVVYGPSDRGLLPLFKMARRGIVPLAGRREAAYSFVHVSDVTRVIAAAVDRGDGDLCYVGHPAPVYPRALAEHIAASFGRRAVVVPVPLALTRVAAWLGDAAGAATGRPTTINSRRYAELASVGFVCRVDRLRERLGVVPEVGVAEGIAGTAAWYAREGWV
jgi:nucleoside-diphosphate-sugar epimerase